MAWKVKYIPSYKLIYIKMKGKVPADEFSDQFKEIEALVRKFGSNRLLYDDTELDVELSTLEIVDMSSWLVVKRSRIAILISPEYKRIENYKFFETACRNRGVNLRLFFSEADALKWLGS